MPIALLSLGSNVTTSALLPATNTVIDAGSRFISRDTTSSSLEPTDKRCAAMCIVEAALSNASSQQCLGSHGTGALTLSSLHGAADHGATGNVSVCFEAQSIDTCVLEDHEAQCSYGNVQQSSSQPPNQPPNPPPALPPALPTIITEDKTWNLLVIAVIIPIAILLVTCVFAFKMRKALRRVRARAQDTQRARLLDALDTTRSLQFPGVLVQLSDFVAMGRLEPFEKLRDSGVRLRYFDALEQLESSDGCKVVFLSHQWTSFTEPDPTGDQYRVMLSSIAHVMDVEDWNPDRVLVWCDYCSVPQGHKGMQGFAINSIASYAACADAFIVVAPDVPHNDLPGVMCDVEQYKNRLWTRVEQLCHGLTNGSHHMWLATSLTECRKAVAEENWLRANLRVFDGEATDEYDKLTLVLPLLGLYAQLYATHAFRATPQQSNAGEEKAIQHPLVWKELCEHKQEIFPERIVIRPKPKPQKLAEPDSPFGPSFNSSRDGSVGAAKTPPKMVRQPSSFNKPSALTVNRMDRLRFGYWWRSGDGVARSDGSLTFELFGGLVEAMEQLLDEDTELHRLV